VLHGYRIGESEETTAWKILDFEYTELENEATKDDLAVFLGMTRKVPLTAAGKTTMVDVPTASWPELLAEFRRRYPDAQGVWVCPTLRDALTYYGAFYGEGVTIYQVTYDPSQLVIDLGPDGRFVLNPSETREVGLDLLAPVKALMNRVYREHRQRYGL
jgi:hypothetical protein